jgi:hypothetical protein
MAQTIGVGVIGMGWMGQVHSRSYNVIKDRFYDEGLLPRLVICSDNVEARARRSCGRGSLRGGSRSAIEKILNHRGRRGHREKENRCERYNCGTFAGSWMGVTDNGVKDCECAVFMGGN